MVTYVKMPKLSLTMKEGIVVNWLKKEGDHVEKGEPLLEVETEKIVNVVEAVSAGVLLKIVTPEGAIVPVSEIVGIIGEPEEEIPPVVKELPKAEMPLEAPEKEEDLETTVVAPAPEERIKISPAARKMAKELKIDVDKVKGTGPEGRIVRDDILRAVEEARVVEPKSSPAAEGIGVTEVIPLTGMRKTMAERLSKSYRSAVHTTVMIEVDMTEAATLRQKLLPKIKEKTGASLTYTGIIIKAVAIALKDHPFVNSMLEGNKIKIMKSINVGVAIDLEEGLIVPVIHKADKKSLDETALLLRKLVEKARKRSLSLEEVTAGTFTVTNLGMFGIHTFVPIINPPQTAILSVGTVQEKPTAINGKIEIRPRINLSLVFDHRIISGAEAARFLQTLQKILENPSTLLG